MFFYSLKLDDFMQEIDIHSKIAEKLLLHDFMVPSTIVQGKMSVSCK